MADTACISDVLQGRFHRSNSHRTNRNIETSAANELPEWLAPWAQNKAWSIRLRQLLLKGYGPHLRRHVQYMDDNAGKIHTSAQNLFNKSWSRAKLEDTLAFMGKLLDLDRRTAEVVQRLKVGKENLRPVYAACWRWGESAIRHAVTAEETARGDLFKYFCWLTSPKRLKEMRSAQT